MLEASTPGDAPPPDVFISHASEDAGEVAGPLAEKLATRGLRVWYDGTEIKLGDSIRKKVDEGLSRSRFGVVILSRHFFQKSWTRNEFDALWGREEGARKVLIPVWHRVTHAEVAAFSTLLAARRGASTDDGLDQVADAIAREVELPGKTTSVYGEGGGASGFTPGDPPRSAGALKDVRDRLDVALCGQYMIEAVIATGDKSVVFRGRDLTLRRQVAVKALDAGGAMLEERSRRLKTFQQSMQLAASLKHRNIVQVYAGRNDDALPYIVLEFVEGVRLDKILHTTGAQPFRKVRDFVWKVGGALEYAHGKGYLHLNLRPTAILIDKEGQPVISPFRFHSESEPGQARPEGWKLSAEEIKYQSPEQYGFAGPTARVAEASDQYALGLIAYEMLVGKPVVLGTTLADIHRDKTRFMKSVPDPRKARPGCPAKLARVVLRMLKKDPEKRYPDLHDARDDLVNIDVDEDSTLDETTRIAMQVAAESYKRCRASTSFFRDFYTSFFEANPDFIRMFPADLEKQYYVLRETLELILQFPAERLTEPTTLTAVAESHRRRNIQSPFYDVFIETLIKTVETHDPLFLKVGKGPAVEEAWKVTVRPAIEYMKSKAPAP
jgi:serine/threonine protein kinase